MKKKATAKKKRLPRNVKMTDVAVADMSEKERIERAQHLETIHLPKSCMTLSRDIARGKVKMGRPSDYTPETVESLLRFVAAGLPLERAAAGAGVTKETLYDWKKTFSDFSDAVAPAETQYANLCHITINEQIIGGDGHLALKTLQSRFSKDYSTSKKVEMQTMSFSSTVSPEQLLEMQQQRRELDSSSDYQSDGIIDITEENEQVSSQSTALGTAEGSDPDAEGGTIAPITPPAQTDPTDPQKGEGGDPSPHPQSNPRTLDPSIWKAYGSPPTTAPTGGELYCLTCSSWIGVEEAEITGSWQADGKSYVNYTCLKCGEAGMSPVKDNE